MVEQINLIMIFLFHNVQLISSIDSISRPVFVIVFQDLLPSPIVLIAAEDPMPLVQKSTAYKSRSQFALLLFGPITEVIA